MAEAAARLPDEKQAELERQLEEAERLTLTDVREVARKETGAATAALPDELFTDHKIAWQATVRGHLTAALTATPGEGYAALSTGSPTCSQRSRSWTKRVTRRGPRSRALYLEG